MRYVPLWVILVFWIVFGIIGAIMLLAGTIEPATYATTMMTATLFVVTMIGFSKKHRTKSGG